MDQLQGRMAEPAGNAVSSDGRAPDGPGDAMLDAKLWHNPCPFTFRINYIALRYNGPLYDWVKRRYGLSRPEYVCLYSLALADGGQASDITRTSGFPKNTLSRAVSRLEALGLVARERSGSGRGRGQALHLTGGGWALFRKTLPVFEARERALLSGLNRQEHSTLLHLLAKVVDSAEAAPSSIGADEEPLSEEDGRP